MTGNYFLSFCCVFYSSLEFLKKNLYKKVHKRRENRQKKEDRIISFEALIYSLEKKEEIC